MLFLGTLPLRTRSPYIGQLFQEQAGLEVYSLVEELCVLSPALPKTTAHLSDRQTDRQEIKKVGGKEERTWEGWGAVMNPLTCENFRH